MERCAVDRRAVLKRCQASVMAVNEEGEVAQLRARIAELEQQLQRIGPKRKKIDAMSAEVVDSNPYRYYI